MRFRGSAAWLCGILALSTAPRVLGQFDFSQWLSPEFGEQEVRANYETFGYFSEDVERRRDRLHLVRHDLWFAVPIGGDERNEWWLLGGVEAYDLDSDVRIPRTLDQLPGELWDVSLGAGYRHKFDNDWVAGAQFAFGSASDRPFASGEEITVTANGFLRIPAGETDGWVFLLNYSNNREFLPNVPIPGIAYDWDPGETVRALLGIPLTSVRWEPLDRLTLEGFYFIPRTIRAKVGYQLLDPLQLYATFAWDNDRFFRADRDDDDDRLFFYEKRVMGGVRWDITEDVWLDLAGGYVFDRFFFEAEEYDDRHGHKLEIDDGPVLRLQLGLSL